MTQGLTYEILKFEIDLVPSYWDKPPSTKILINNEEKYSGFVTENIKVKFEHKLEFNKNHTLTIVRSNKTDDQVKTVDNIRYDQSLEIEKLKIDGINCKGLMNRYSYTIFEYPEAYKKDQKEKGIDLPHSVPAATLMAHNGIWDFNFSSPFYIFIMKWMGGGVYSE